MAHSILPNVLHQEIEMQLFVFPLFDYTFTREREIVIRSLAVYRSSRPKLFCKKGILKNFAKFTGKTPLSDSFFK